MIMIRKGKNWRLLLSIAFILVVSSCATTKDLAYIQSADREIALQRDELQETRIAPKDILTVNVQASKPELVAAFNGLYWNPTQQYQSQGSYGVRTFLVDNDGTIDLPILGQTHVADLTLREAENLVKEKLVPYLNETPSVNVQLKNFRYSVLGEVQRPGAFTADNGKVTIFDALANAGDMTIYGIRDEVKLIREERDGSQKIITLNLKDADIIQSPYYYLKQGDILYVLPNNARSSASDISSGITIWFSATSIAVSLANLVITILRK